MNFLYPQFLYGLFALAIPIIVHLFNFRRTRKVYFSNTKFLKKVKETSSSKLRLKHYLILFSRLLFIFFLVMAFAQPIIIADKDISAQQNVLIYFDNSQSMSNEVDESLPAFDRGIAYIEELTEKLPTSTSYKLLTNDFDAAGLVPQSKTEVSDLLTEMIYSSSTRSLSEVLNRINAIDQKPENIYWISDFQSVNKEKGMLEIDTVMQVNIIPLPFMSVKNIAVDSIWLKDPFLIGDQKIQLNVKLRNYGLSAVEDLILKVFVDEVQSATASINIPANASAETTFDLAFELQDISKCRLSFEEFPVTFDNEFYFTINGTNKINVLEIKGTDEITSVSKVYGNENLFSLNSINISNLDYSLIEQNDLIVLNSVDEIDASLVAVLNEHLSDFGTLLFISGSQPDIDTYRSILGMSGITTKDSLYNTELSAPDFDNPFFNNVFEEQNVNMAMPSAKKIIDWGMDRSAILNFKNGEPFLSVKTVPGNLYLMSSPLQKDFNTFDAHALFVPVMYRVALESASADNKLYYFIDQPQISLKSDAIQSDQVFKLKNKETEIIPSQRIIGNNITIDVPGHLLEQGFYDVILDEMKVNTLAFNRNFAESDLNQLGQEDLKNTFQGNVNFFEAGNVTAFGNEIESKFVGISLWKYALLLALLFLLVEVLLIRFFP